MQLSIYLQKLQVDSLMLCISLNLQAHPELIRFGNDRRYRMWSFSVICLKTITHFKPSRPCIQANCKTYMRPSLIQTAVKSLYFDNKQAFHIQGILNVFPVGRGTCTFIQFGVVHAFKVLQCDFRPCEQMPFVICEKFGCMGDLYFAVPSTIKSINFLHTLKRLCQRVIFPNYSITRSSRYSTC